MHLMFQPLVKYADFQGRARRSEYWLFYLLHWIVVFAAVAAVLLVFVSPATPEHKATALGCIVLLYGLVSAAAMIPSFAVSVRRLHDSGRSGCWFLIVLIPVIGAVIWLVLAVEDSMPGPNRYGRDPKRRPAPAGLTPAEMHHFQRMLRDPAAMTLDASSPAAEA
jgi:uncharacterized membrane protein YhaH (DUF805 family)